MDMNSSEKYKSFCLCLGTPLHEYVIDAQEIRKKSLGTSEEEFNAGYLCGFHRVITLMQQTAEEWKIPFDKLGINFDENDLI